MTPDDVKRCEARNGLLPEGCCVVMNSGWHRLLDSPRLAGHDDKGKNHTPRPGAKRPTARLTRVSRKLRRGG